jgi:hypothetical protein
MLLWFPCFDVPGCPYCASIVSLSWLAVAAHLVMLHRFPCYDVPGCWYCSSVVFLVGLTVVDHLACFSDILVLASWLLRFPLSPAGAGHLAVLKWFSCACVPGCWYLLRLSGFLVLIGCCRRLGHASVVSHGFAVLQTFLCPPLLLPTVWSCFTGSLVVVSLDAGTALWLFYRCGCLLLPTWSCFSGFLFWCPWPLRVPFFGWCWPPGHASLVSLCWFPWLLVIIVLPWIPCPELLLQTTWSCFSGLLFWCPWLSVLRFNRILVLASCC